MSSLLNPNFSEENFKNFSHIGFNHPVYQDESIRIQSDNKNKDNSTMIDIGINFALAIIIVCVAYIYFSIKNQTRK